MDQKNPVVCVEELTAGVEGYWGLWAGEIYN